MEYRINLDKVLKSHTKRPINPAYQESPKSWVGKFIITIWKSSKNSDYLHLFKQKLFDKKEDAIEFGKKFIKSRRKTTEISIGGSLRKELI